MSTSTRRPMTIVRTLIVVALVVIVIASMVTPEPLALAARGASLPPSDRAPAKEAIQIGSVMFIENAGQFAEGARFQVRGGNGTMWLAEDAIWITMMEPEARDQSSDLRRGMPAEFEPPTSGQPRHGVNIKLSFVGANPQPRLEAYDRLDTVLSYFIGSDSDQWRPEVSVWGGVRYVDLYPGVDLAISGEGGQMVQRLAARPGTDLGAVRLRVEGADAVTLDGDALHVSTAAGEVAVPLLLASDASGATAVQPQGAQVFDVTAPFTLSPPDRQSKIKNPQSPADNPADLLYGTFLGGGNYEIGYAFVVDGVGSAYVTGYTYSSDFPTTPGAFDRSHNGESDTFVAKLNPAGSGLAYATFLGGSRDDWGYAIAVGGAGSAYVTGYTSSNDFPTTPGAFDRSHNGGFDAFVTKLNPTGSELTYATFLGGSCDDVVHAIVVSEAGSAYATGLTCSSDFPTTAGAFDRTYNGNYDVFVTKLETDGSALLASTYLGGANYDSGHNLAVRQGDIYVVGGSGGGFPTTSGAFDTTPNGCSDDYPWCDAFMTRLSPDASHMTFSTYLGGNLGD